MPSWGRVSAMGFDAVVAACLLAWRGNGPTTAHKNAVHDILTPTTTTVPATNSTSTSPTPTTQPGFAVPN